MSNFGLLSNEIFIIRNTTKKRKIGTSRKTDFGKNERLRTLLTFKLVKHKNGYEWAERGRCVLRGSNSFRWQTDLLQNTPKERTQIPGKCKAENY